MSLIGLSLFLSQQLLSRNKDHVFNHKAGHRQLAFNIQSPRHNHYRIQTFVTYHQYTLIVTELVRTDDLGQGTNQNRADGKRVL